MIWQLLNWILVFFLTLVNDVVWARYIVHVGEKNVHRASAFAAVIILFGGLSVVEYTHDLWLLIPGAAGAYLGTFITVRRASS